MAGYGTGRARLLRDYGMEEAQERRRYSSEVGMAGRARSIEQERKSLWGLLGMAAGAVIAPWAIPVGLAAGKAVGGTMTIDGEDAEDYFVSEDVGRFNRSEEYERQDVNRMLRKEDKADLWRDVGDVGKAAMLAFTLGGGSMKDPSNVSLTHYGGKKAAAEGGYGAGLFGKGSEVLHPDEWLDYGRSGRTYWDHLFSGPSKVA